MFPSIFHPRISQDCLQEDSDNHDLRRTCRTLMSRLGVEHDIAELAIGHKRTGLDRLYNFDQAWQLRCDAFAKVTEHITTLIGARAALAPWPRAYDLAGSRS